MDWRSLTPFHTRGDFPDIEATRIFDRVRDLMQSLGKVVSEVLSPAILTHLHISVKFRSSLDDGTI
jgi:hypothetical protein